jgi:hypothetical protein
MAAASSNPIHARNPDYVPEVFDHPNLIAYFCKWWKPEVYLEYGLSSCLTTKAVAPFCKRIIGVDVNHHPAMDTIPNLEFHRMKTSEFKPILDKLGVKLDVVFIDAWHESETVFQDFQDVFPHVAENGLIFMHDTYPCFPKYVAENYCWDAWKAPHLIKQMYGDQCEVLTIPVQPGLTMVKKLGPKLSWMDTATIRERPEKKVDEAENRSATSPEGVSGNAVTAQAVSKDPEKTQESSSPIVDPVSSIISTKAQDG